MIPIQCAATGSLLFTTRRHVTVNLSELKNCKRIYRVCTGALRMYLASSWLLPQPSAAEFVEFLCRNVHSPRCCRVVVMFPFKNNNSKPLLRDSRSDSGINCACVRANLAAIFAHMLIVYKFSLRARGALRANLDLLATQGF